MESCYEMEGSEYYKNQEKWLLCKEEGILVGTGHRERLGE